MTKISDEWAYPHWYAASLGPAVGGAGSLYVVPSPGKRPVVVVHSGHCYRLGFTPEQLADCDQQPSCVFATEFDLQDWGYRPIYGDWEDRLRAIREVQKMPAGVDSYDYEWVAASGGGGSR